MSYYNNKKRHIAKTVLLVLTSAHAIIALGYWLVWPTLQRVYFGIPQFWLEFDVGRGMSICIYLTLTFIFGLVSVLTLADEI